MDWQSLLDSVLIWFNLVFSILIFSRVTFKDRW